VIPFWVGALLVPSHPSGELAKDAKDVGESHPDSGEIHSFAAKSWCII